jgi:hypothetical protein
MDVKFLISLTHLVFVYSFLAFTRVLHYKLDKHETKQKHVRRKKYKIQNLIVSSRLNLHKRTVDTNGSFNG